MSIPITPGLSVVLACFWQEDGTYPLSFPYASSGHLWGGRPTLSVCDHVSRSPELKSASGRSDNARVPLSHPNVTGALVGRGLGAVSVNPRRRLLCLWRPHPVCGPKKLFETSVDSGQWIEPESDYQFITTPLPYALANLPRDGDSLP